MNAGKPETANCEKKHTSIVRALCLSLGIVCIVLGTIGIALPILPTTPFLLAASACFCKSSERMNNWLLNNKWFGSYIRNYKEGHGIPMKTKIIALAVLWITIGVSTVFFLGHMLPDFLVLPMQLVMGAVAVGVTIHIARLPTSEKTKPKK
ncbi:MAG: YbaN family protein [Candidatus Bathyarchaeota archaeon]|nr:YbaN family protein [Candidatus Bathyarchaeota archaeon]